jgi:sulfur-oxidizing protein SoxY
MINATRMSRRSALSLALVAAAPSAVFAQASQDESRKIWQSLKAEIFGDRAIKEGTDIVKIAAPKRAQDAGLVPVDIEINSVTAAGPVRNVTFVIDVNPSPLAAKFTIGKDSGLRHISTRVRVNDYSFLRVIAETEGGELHMSEIYVKASGGCSAPAVKSPAEAKATMGVMKLKQFSPEAAASSSALREMQIMIRHPNNSGYQMDQITRNYIPPHFIQFINIAQGGQPILGIEGGISISEDPNFRIDYFPKGQGEIVVEAVDTEGMKFNSKWPLESSGI